MSMRSELEALAQKHQSFGDKPQCQIPDVHHMFAVCIRNILAAYPEPPVAPVGMPTRVQCVNAAKARLSESATRFRSSHEEVVAAVLALFPAPVAAKDGEAVGVVTRQLQENESAIREVLGLSTYEPLYESVVSLVAEDERLTKENHDLRELCRSLQGGGAMADHNAMTAEWAALQSKLEGQLTASNERIESLLQQHRLRAEENRALAKQAKRAEARATLAEERLEKDREEHAALQKQSHERTDAAEKNAREAREALGTMGREGDALAKQLRAQLAELRAGVTLLASGWLAESADKSNDMRSRVLKRCQGELAMLAPPFSASPSTPVAPVQSGVTLKQPPAHGESVAVSYALAAVQERPAVGSVHNWAVAKADMEANPHARWCLSSDAGGVAPCRWDGVLQYDRDRNGVWRESGVDVESEGWRRLPDAVAPVQPSAPSPLAAAPGAASAPGTCHSAVEGVTTGAGGRTERPAVTGERVTLTNVHVFDPGYQLPPSRRPEVGETCSWYHAKADMMEHPEARYRDIIPNGQLWQDRYRCLDGRFQRSQTGRDGTWEEGIRSNSEHARFEWTRLPDDDAPAPAQASEGAESADDRCADLERRMALAETKASRLAHALTALAHGNSPLRIENILTGKEVTDV